MRWVSRPRFVGERQTPDGCREVLPRLLDPAGVVGAPAVRLAIACPLPCPRIARGLLAAVARIAAGYEKGGVSYVRPSNLPSFSLHAGGPDYAERLAREEPARGDEDLAAVARLVAADSPHVLDPFRAYHVGPRGGVAAALVLILIPFCFTGRALLTGRVYAPIDLPFMAEPLKDYAVEGAGDYYQIPFKTGQQAVLEPYSYRAGDRDVLFFSGAWSDPIRGSIVTVRAAQAELTTAEWGEALRACKLRRETIYVSQPWFRQPVSVPCLERAGVRHYLFEQYARGGRIDVWFVPPA